MLKDKKAFDDTLDLGISGQLGGTTQEFVADFSNQFGSTPKPISAVSLFIVLLLFFFFLIKYS
jgi:hypothetical protein